MFTVSFHIEQDKLCSANYYDADPLEVFKTSYLPLGLYSQDIFGDVRACSWDTQKFLIADLFYLNRRKFMIRKRLGMLGVGIRRQISLFIGRKLESVESIPSNEEICLLEPFLHGSRHWQFCCQWGIGDR